ncbi:MAG TPA: hypothetical protein ENN09_03310 [Planctomycetes bacterium]|nr:hypothetical protein [Planctomycetota bacterium]
MKRNVAACVAACLLAVGAYAEGISLSLSLPRRGFHRGAQKPVEGLIAEVTIRNNTNVAVLLAEPTLHPEAAPAIAAKAVIRRMEETGQPGEPLPTITGLVPPLTPASIKTIRLDAGRQVMVPLDIGPYYLIRKAGEYEMSIVYRGMESNKARFTLLPVRRVAVPGKMLMEKIRELEWGEPDYSEMFYVVSGTKAWEDIVMVQRLGNNLAYPLIPTTVGYTTPGSIPKMLIPRPRVYVMLYPEKTGRGWTAVKVDCSKDPFTTVYKHYGADAELTIEDAVNDLK